MPTPSPPVYNKRYELSHQIARGGTAQVYLARDLLLDRPVALKMLFPELSTDRTFVDRFRREAQAAANLSHPNIVPIFDWGESDRTYYIVMEYVDGEPLSSIVRTQAPLDGAQAAGIAADIAKALSYAHRHGVVHRDVKPGNVLITSDGQVKVADFGIARAIGSDENVTQTGLVMGTATYFSPEQAQGLGVDGRSDVYSLGVVLFEMLTGRPPFSGETPVSIAYQHVREPAPTPRSINPAIPLTLEAIVLQAMAKQPAERYQTAQDLQADLQRYVQGGSVLAGAPPVLPSPVVPNRGAGGDRFDAPGGATSVVPADRGGATTALAAGALGAAAVAAGAGAADLAGAGATGLAGSDAAGLAGAGSAAGGGPLGGSGGIGGAGSAAGGEAGMAAGAAGAAAAMGATTSAATLAPPAGATRPDATAGQLPTGATGAGGVPGVPSKGEPRRVDGKPPLPKTRSLEWAGAAVVLIVAMCLIAFFGGRALGYFGGKPWFPAPDEQGKSLATAEHNLRQQGLAYKVVLREYSLQVGAQVVLGQSPGGGSSVRQGDTIDLTVSKGPASAEVPMVVGLILAQAEQDLENDHFKVGQVTYKPAPQGTNYQQGEVYAQDPTGTEKEGTAVNLSVVKGLRSVPIPTVPAGDTQIQAVNILTSAGFKVSSQTTSESSSTVPQGDVIATNPPGGTTERLGTSVTLVISTGPPPPQVVIPNVYGDTASQATTALENHQFQVKDETVTVCSKKQDGRVQETDPAIGTSQPQGSTVTIEIGSYDPSSVACGTSTSTSTPTGGTGTTGVTGTTGTGTTGH